MKKQILFFLTIVITFSGYSQILFEKGYYIDNNNQRTNCLIRNVDWKNNPTKFEYKLSEKDEIKKHTIKSVKEFGVDGFSKYIKDNVNIDRSKEIIKNLSNNRNPIFKEEELFLKVLIEGKSNLYVYKSSNLLRFFYNNEDSNIEQLVFKSYRTTENKIGQNNYFKQQLINDLKCDKLTKNKIERIGYHKKDLVRVFTEYNECFDSDLINFEPKEKRDLFNLTVRPRLNNSSLSVENTNLFSNTVINFDNKTGLCLGLEAEVILPFNKNKWAFFIESTYQSFKSEGKISNVNIIFGGELTTKIDYSSIEVPLGFRHYIFLNKNSKVFLDGSLVLDFQLKSSFEGELFNGSEVFSIEKSRSSENFAFGIGSKFYDKYSLEFRYQTNRSIISTNTNSSWISDYKTLSIIFGYTLF